MGARAAGGLALLMRSDSLRLMMNSEGASTSGNPLRAVNELPEQNSELAASKTLA